jgi:hypothetical protein
MIAVPLRQLASFDEGSGNWRLGAAPWRIFVGASSAERDGRSVRIALPERTWSVRER